MPPLAYTHHTAAWIKKTGKEECPYQNSTAPGNAAHYNPKKMVWAMHSRGTVPG